MVDRAIKTVQRVAWLLPEPRPSCIVHRNTTTRDGTPVTRWFDAVLWRELQLLRPSATHEEGTGEPVPRRLLLSRG